MEEHKVKIISVEPVTHNVRRFTVEKPAGYHFIPGQATEVSIPKSGWENEKRPFTFTSLNEWKHLEFTIKIYDDHQGVTHQLGTLKAGDNLVIRDVWGAIQYKGEGVFIAGGAGVTPFIAILRQLNQEGKIGGNLLLFSNQGPRDIILKQEFTRMLGKQFINTLTDEQAPGYDHSKIDADWLKQKLPDLKRKFYICGPEQMISDLKVALTQLGVAGEAVTVEL